MAKKLDNLEELGEVTQLINDFKVVKKAYFDLKRQHSGLIQNDRESVDDDYWEDQSFEEEVKIFEKRKKLYDEAQDLYRAMKAKLQR